MKSIKLLDTLEENKIIELGRGKVISKIEMNNNKGCFPVYSSAATGNGKFGEYGKYMFDDERITWSIDGGGKFFYREKHKYSVTNVCGWIKINNPAMLNTKYVYYNLLNQWKYLSFDYVSKAPPSKIKKVYSINIINLDKQKKIVNDLDRVQQKIDINNDILSNINELIKSQFVELFNDRFKGELIKLGDIAEFVIGLTYKPQNISKEGTIVLRSGNIQNNDLYLEDDIVKVSNINIPEHKFVKKNDILMCARNGSARLVGKSCLINELNEKMSFGAFMTIIRSKFPYFLQGFFLSEYFKSQLTGVATTTVNQITSGMLSNYKIIIPTDNDERVFSNFYKQCDKLKFIVQQRIDLLNELLNTKMHEYFDEE